MGLNRAYSLLTVRSVDTERRTITGIATSPTPDRMGDIIEPLGIEFRNPLPLLLYHDATKPVGIVTFDRPTKAGVTFTATIADVTDPGPLKDRVQEAWASIKAQLIRGVSIGFRVLAGGAELLKDNSGMRFLKTEVLELSLVTVPANAEATILTIKSLAAADLAMLGTGSDRPSFTPRAAGRIREQTMNISEQIETAKADLRTKSTRLEELMLRDDLSDVEQQECDSLSAAVGTETKRVKNLETLEAAQATNAKTIDFRPPTQTVERGRIQVVTRELPKGTGFTRYAMAVAAGKGSISDTLAYAKRWERESPEVIQFIKAEAGSSVAGSPGWGSELVYQTNLASEFIELLRPVTIIGKLTGLRRVPFNVRIPRQTTGGTVNWVGIKAAKPVTELAFDTVTLGYSKIAGIIVLTEELVRLGTPSAEETVRRDLVEQIARFMDDQFLDPNVTASADNPASITNGVSSPIATGTDADAVYADMNIALATFDATNLGTGGLYVIMTPALARGISTLMTPLGVPAFPALNPGGGTLLGFPVIVSNSCPSGTVILVKADEILLADDGQVRLDASNQATLDMAGGDNPDFNLWQKNCIGIRAERWICWAKRRDDCVAVIDTASYGPAVGSP